MDEWAALNADARRKASQREREALERMLGEHTRRPEDIADVLANQPGRVAAFGNVQNEDGLPALLQGGW